jgi:hypothetical protein
MKSYNCSFQIFITKTGGLSYPLLGATVTFAVNGVPTAQIDMAVGSNSPGINNAINIDFEQGDEIKLRVINSSFDNPFTPSGSFVLFTGIVYDVGPSDVSYGSFAVRITATGKSSWLNSGTLQSSSIVSHSLADMGSIGDMLASAGMSKFTIDSELVVKNGLGPEVVGLMQKIATDKEALDNSLSKFLQERFADGPNKLADTLLGNIEYDNDGVKFKTVSADDGEDITVNFIDGVTEQINNLFSGDADMSSFLQRLITIGELTNAVFIETANRLLFVPSIPFIKSTDCKTISGDSYNSIQGHLRSDGPINRYLGCVIVSGDGRVAAGIDNEGLIGGFYDRTAGNSISPLGSAVVSGNSLQPKQGVVLILPPPPILSAAITVGDNLQEDAANGRNLTSVFSLGLGNELAKLLCWLKTYEPQTYTVGCPYLRTDICPGTHVRVLYPNVPEIQAGADTAAIYGYTQSVTISVNSAQQTASTSYEIGFARSSNQQHKEIDKAYVGHPIFTSNWKGGRIVGTDAVSGRDGFDF